MGFLWVVVFRVLHGKVSSGVLGKPHQQRSATIVRSYPPVTVIKEEAHNKKALIIIPRVRFEYKRWSYALARREHPTKNSARRGRHHEPIKRYMVVWSSYIVTSVVVFVLTNIRCIVFVGVEKVDL